MSDLPTAADLAYRAAGPEDGPTVVCVHGWPESSYMWRAVLEALGAAGMRAYAPDLPGYGASAVRRPATWTMHVEALEAFRTALGIERTALCVHDWGGLIGLRWACDHPEAITALTISDTGFFADGKWHDLADVMRTPGQGEELMGNLNREAFGAVLANASKGMDAAALDEYFRAFATQDGQLAQLDLYRSGEFSELALYEDKLRALTVPTLLLWGEDDPFAPVAGAHRFKEMLPHAELDVIPGAGHFVADDAPGDFAARITAFLARATMAG